MAAACATGLRVSGSVDLLEAYTALSESSLEELAAENSINIENFRMRIAEIATSIFSGVVAVQAKLRERTFQVLKTYPELSGHVYDESTLQVLTQEVTNGKLHEELLKYLEENSELARKRYSEIADDSITRSLFKKAIEQVLIPHMADNSALALLNEEHISPDTLRQVAFLFLP